MVSAIKSGTKDQFDIIDFVTVTWMPSSYSEIVCLQRSLGFNIEASGKAFWIST